MSCSLEPRLLNFHDLTAAMELCEEAGWNQTLEDWRMLLERNRNACLGIDIDGELAAATTLIPYGTRLGWIGMVLTRKRFRRRGCARVLLEHAIESAATQGIKTLKLDATEMGAPLYTSLGFTDEQPVERWRADKPRNLELGKDCCRETIPDGLDAQAFGADRLPVLRSLAARGALITSSAAYALTRIGRVASYLGPCVAESSLAAAGVIEPALAQGGAWYWDLLPDNSAAVELARRFGFSPVRTLRRMWRGEPLRGREEYVFALGGFELG